MPETLEKYDWSEWRNFPDPRIGNYLIAPFGFGLYQLRNIKSNEYILFGIGNNCAYRISSLLPRPLGQGTRNNNFKRIYVLQNISDLQYRTISFLSKEKMSKSEKEIKKLKLHKFNS